MTPTEYEHHVAALLATEGWVTRVTPPQRDFGLDIICEQSERRLGVQVKMYGAGTRSVNAQMVMQLHGAAAFQDCAEAMLVTDGRVLKDAERVAAKLGIEIRHVPARNGGVLASASGESDASEVQWTFDAVWKEHVMPLVGRELVRSDGSSNVILSVDWSGLKRRTSNGRIQIIAIEIFRWAIERMLNGETVLGAEINAQYPKRASSGILLILGSVPMFEIVKIDRKSGIRSRIPQ